MVAASTVIAIAVNMILGILIPIVLFFILKKRFGNHWKAFLTGCLIMFVFAFILESLLHQIVLRGSLGSLITGNIWIYALYGAAMAALFEETGRLVAFKYVLKKHRNDDGTAMLYGAGHGGFEAFYLLFVSGLSNLLFVAMINSGNSAALTTGLEGSSLAQVESTIEQMLEISWPVFLLSPVERIAAVALQISLSVLVWFAVKYGEYKLYGLALLFHFGLDFVAVIVNSYLTGFGIAGSVIVEIIIWIMAIAVAFYGKEVWKKHHD